MPAYSPDIAHAVPASADATGRMDRMYRWQRHIYNLTRRYYLLGRDRLIADLQPAAGADVLEIGCGTGRNLLRAARLYPHARFFGIDISNEMLKSSMAAISRSGLAARIRVAHGDGAAFDPSELFQTPSFDHIMISYSLSMIPGWRDVLRAAIHCLAPGGQLHVVDFGGQERLPSVMRNALRRWLALFDVNPREDLEAVMSALAEDCSAALRFERPFHGYAQYAVMTRARPDFAGCRSSS